MYSTKHFSMQHSLKQYCLSLNLHNYHKTVEFNDGGWFKTNFKYLNNSFLNLKGTITLFYNEVKCSIPHLTFYLNLYLCVLSYM